MPIPGGARKSSSYRRARAERLALARMQEEPCIRCGGQIDYSLSGNHPHGPTLDHLIAVSHTGSEEFTEETSGISHRVCNLRAGTRPVPMRTARRDESESESNTESDDDRADRDGSRFF